MAAKKKPYKLKLTKLDWLSSVDAPAQGAGARALLVKGANADSFELQAKVSKLDDELGLVWGYAFSSSLDGGQTPHVDCQDDWITPDFMKAVTEWLLDGGKTDVNHDCDKDGRIAYAWPFLPEYNKAFGINPDTIGLAVAVKPSADTYAKFKSGELTGFSIFGTGIREPLEQAKRATTVKASGFAPGDRVSVPTEKAHMPEASGPGTVVVIDGNALGIVFDGNPSMVHRWYTLDEVEDLGGGDMAKRDARVIKASLYTDLVDGHQHEIRCYEDGGFYVCYATSEGADREHSHGIVFESGQLTILADSGHTHTLAEGQPALAVVPEGAIVVVAARAIPTTNRVALTGAHSKSTRAGALPHGGHQEDKTMDKDAEIASLRKTLAALVTLTAAEHAYHKTLSADDGAAFLAKSGAERAALAADFAKREADANAIVYTSKSGRTFRKADEASGLVEMAKQLDAQSETIEKADIRKRAEECLGGMAGSDAVHDLIVRSLLKSGAKQEEIDAAFTAMKGWKSTNRVGKNAAGIEIETPPEGNAELPHVKLRKHVEKFQADNKIATYEQALTKALATDEETKRLYSAARN